MNEKEWITVSQGVDGFLMLAIKVGTCLALLKYLGTRRA